MGRSGYMKTPDAKEVSYSYDTISTGGDTLMSVAPKYDYEIHWIDWTSPNTGGDTPWKRPNREPWPNEPRDKNVVDWEEIKRILDEPTKEEIEMENRKDIMKVYEVVVVDKRSCEILGEQKVTARDTETAAFQLDLTGDVKKRVKNDEIKFIFKELGSFEVIRDKED